MPDYDLAVIGGGPAGSTLATLVARRGHRVVLFERETGPRYRVGESLLPATLQAIAPLLGVGPALEAAGFVVKRGATFAWGDRPDAPWTLPFGPGSTPGGPPAPTALNVTRSRFDEILLDNARHCGVEVRRGCSVQSIGAPAADRRRTIDVGAATQVRARFVANASGQARLDAPGLEARQHSKFFRKMAVWGYWRGAARLPAPLDGNVFFETLRTEAGEAWLWFIPLSGGLTSVGVVAPRASAARIRQDSRAALTAYLSACPRTTALLAGAVPADEPPYDAVRTCADYSYASDAYWAPGLFQVGDAACFVDILLSSGVHLATYGALLAARSVDAVLRGTADEAHAMNEYESRLRQEFAVFYAGLTGLYDMSRPREHHAAWLRALLENSNGVRLEWRAVPGSPGGLNCDVAPPAEGTPAERAARNAAVMRRFNLGQLAYDGPPRSIDPRALPALRNTLCLAQDGFWTAEYGQPTGDAEATGPARTAPTAA